MIRTQIQLPDQLYKAAKDVAKSREVSLAELIRRGLEYMVTVSPEKTDAEWTLPEPFHLGGSDPFADPDWRADVHAEGRLVAESRAPAYGRKKRSKRK